MALGQEGESEALNSVEREAKRFRVSTEPSAGPGDAPLRWEVDLPDANDVATTTAPREYVMPEKVLEESGIDPMQAFAELLKEEPSDGAQEHLLEDFGLEKLAEPRQTCEEPPANPSVDLPRELPKELFDNLQASMEDALEEPYGEPAAELQSAISEDAQMQSGDGQEVSPEYSPVDPASMEDAPEEPSGEPEAELQSAVSEDAQMQSGDGQEVSPEYSPVDVPEEACDGPPAELQNANSEEAETQSGDDCEVSPDYSPVDVPEEACGGPPPELPDSEDAEMQPEDGCDVSPEYSPVDPDDEPVTGKQHLEEAVAASSDADLHPASMVGGASTGAERQPTPGPSANIKSDPETHAGIQPKIVNGSNHRGAVKEDRARGITIRVKVEPSDGTNGPPTSPAPARPGSERAARGFRCERGLPGAIAGVCLGGPFLGLWRDDAPGRRAELIRFGPSCVGRVYCGRCWEEFEASAARATASSEQQPVQKMPPLPGRAGCQRWPAQACHGKPEDELCVDEEGGGIFCGSCWEEFEKAGLVIADMEPQEPPEVSGWTLVESRSHPGLRYWFHARLGKTQWAKPT